MDIKRIEKAIDITASQQNVWRVLIEDEFTRQWFAEFSPGTFAETDWKVGSKVIYVDDSKSGMIGTVVVNDPPNQLAVETKGEIINGKEEYASDSAHSMSGGKEIYTLSNNHGLTHLAIETGMPADYYDTMTVAWDRAVQKIRMLAEMLEVQN